MIITCACGGFGEPHVVGSKDKEIWGCVYFFMLLHVTFVFW